MKRLALSRTSKKQNTLIIAPKDSLGDKRLDKLLNLPGKFNISDVTTDLEGLEIEELACENLIIIDPEKKRMGSKK